MNESKISVRYAKALFLAAESQKVLPEIAKDIHLITGLINESDDFLIFLQSSVVKRHQKKQIFETILGEKVHALTLQFLMLLADNRREIKLPDMCRNFIDLYRKYQGIEPVLITTATELTPDVRNTISSYLEEKTGKTIEMAEKVDNDIIGGLVLRIGDLQYDGSIANQLKKVKESLMEKELFNFTK